MIKESSTTAYPTSLTIDVWNIQGVELGPPSQDTVPKHAKTVHSQVRSTDVPDQEDYLKVMSQCCIDQDNAVNVLKCSKLRSC